LKAQCETVAEKAVGGRDTRQGRFGEKINQIGANIYAGIKIGAVPVRNPLFCPE
jgi:hypothetical protein